MPPNSRRSQAPSRPGDGAWPLQFRDRGSRRETAVAQLFPLGGYAHMRHFAISSLISLLVSGCVYPAWSIDNIPAEDLPRPVKSAFWEGFPGARISKVERGTFGSRMSGYPKKYRIFFARPGSENLVVNYDSTGALEGLSFDR